MSADPIQPAGPSRRWLLGSLPAAALMHMAPAFAQPAPRIVSLDYGLASTLLALGVVPAGISDLAGWDKWVVEPRMPAGVADLGTSTEPNLEVLGQLKPDFILTTPYLDAQTARLREFGRVLRLETFRYEGTPILQAVIAATRKLADEIGRQPQAERFLSEAETFFDDCRTRLASVSAPVALVNFMDARHVRIYGSPGLFHDVLERIGLANAWTERSSEWGLQTVAIEELSRIESADARLIAFDPVPPDVLPRLRRSPLWQSLPIARPGHFHVLPPALMFGMVNEAMRFAGLVTRLMESEA